MASRAIPPHQLISAPLMPMTPLRISARAGAAGTHNSPSPSRMTVRCMAPPFWSCLPPSEPEASATVRGPPQPSLTLPARTADLVRYLLDGRPERLLARLVVFFQLSVGADDRRQFADDRSQVPA